MLEIVWFGPLQKGALIIVISPVKLRFDTLCALSSIYWAVVSRTILHKLRKCPRWVFFIGGVGGMFLVRIIPNLYGELLNV